jgi:DNA-binding response OmpR family regulator
MSTRLEEVETPMAANVPRRPKESKRYVTRSFDFSKRQQYNGVTFGTVNGPQEGAVSKHIMIVESDEAFATILKEGIELGGEFQATIASTASQARSLTGQQSLAMAIVDMGLKDEDPLELLQTLRDGNPELRLMVIPLDELPAEAEALGIQGTLSKPFFLPDIPGRIEDALSRPIGTLPEIPEPKEAVEEPADEIADVGEVADLRETPQKSVPAPTVPSKQLLAHLASESQRLTDQLRFLSRELNAEAVLLTYGTELVAYAGHFARAEAERLAQVVSESWQASTRVAAALGRETVRFEQSLHEGQDYLLYSLATTSEIVLSVALRADRPLGMIRYNTKQTARELQPILTPR